MARNDVYLNINALSPADAVVTGQQDMTAATVPELVLGDTPTFNFYFTDNTNVWPSWAGNASYTLTWALSDAVAGDFAPAATTGNATPITGGWSVILPLNSYDLVGLLNTKRVGQPYPVQNLWQQLRVTDPSGNEVTRAMFWTPVRYRAISDTQNTESASPTGGRFVTINNVNTLTTPTAAQFYAANPVPTSALGTAANGELLIGNGTGFTKATLTAGSGVSITNGSGSITITATDGDITLDDGTAAAPSLKFTADTDTGIYRPSDNVVGISAGGVSRATFGATSAINGTTIPSSKTLVVTTDKLSALAATTSAELAGVISDETGSGALVFANTPTLVTPNIGAATGTSFNLTGSGTLGTTLTVNSTTDSSSKDTGAIVTEGGLGVEKSATIGGNLTVSGTGTHSFSGQVTSFANSANTANLGSFVASNATLNSFTSYSPSASLDQKYWTWQAGTAVGDGTIRLRALNDAGTNGINALTVTRTGISSTAVQVGGNLTVSGTSSLTGNVTLGLAANLNLLGNDPSNAYIQLNNSLSSGNSKYRLTAGVNGVRQEGFSIYEVTTAATLLNLHQNGNLCLGTTNDSSNGRLQLATHTTSAGGIGFGTDVSLYRTSTSALAFNGTTGDPQFQLARGGTIQASFLLDGASVYFGSVSTQSLILRTNATTALTIDSSQNATFAGRVISNGTGYGVGANSDANTPFNALTSINGTFGALIRNTNAGSSAFAGINIEADSGQAGFRQYSTAHSVWGGKTLISAPSGGTGLVLLTNGAGDAIDFWTNATQALSIDASQNIVPGTAALATTATNGFIYLQTCAGAPTGVPTTYTGRVASIYDTTNNKLYVYNGGWKSVILA